MMPFDLSSITMVDQHCHSVVDESQALDVQLLLRATSEARSSYPKRDLEQTITWQAVLKLVRETTGEPAYTTADLSAILSGTDYEQYCRRLFDQSGYEKLLIDTGFAPKSAYSLSELARVTGTTTHAILRLEDWAERLVAPNKSFETWWDELSTTVRMARQHGYVGAKSIAAYRSGLDIAPVAFSDAKEAYVRWVASGSDRLADPKLLNFVLWENVPALIDQDLPLQFHTGYGDPDEDLRQGNPLNLRGFLEVFSPRGLSTVLLHTYPFHREAGYLASVYPGVYFDVSLIIPLGVTSSRRVVAEALELTPISRFLFASDAHTRPELYALSATCFRDALGAYFSDEVVRNFVTVEQAEVFAQMILRENALALYFGKHHHG